MRLLSLCALPVGAVYWVGSAPLPGGAAPGPKLTVVVKATFALSFGLAELSPHPRPMAGNEAVWIDDESHPYVCSDFEPFKLRSDIVLVGHAFSQTPRELIPLSFGVDTYRKSAVAVAGTPTHTIPLIAGHLRSEADPQGPATSVGPRHPEGLRRLTERPDATWLELEGRELLYPSFNSAPEDQQLTVPISESATIMLAGLTRDAPQKVFRLPGLRPQLFYLDPTPKPGQPTDRKVPLVCDTLWMDVDHSVLTLSWRGIVPLAPGEDAPDLIMSLGLVGASKRHDDIWQQRARASEVELVTAQDIAPPTPKKGELPRSPTMQLAPVGSGTQKMSDVEKAAWSATSDPDGGPTPLHDETTDDASEQEDDEDERATQRPPPLADAEPPKGLGLGKLPTVGRLGAKGTSMGLVLGKAPEKAQRRPEDPLSRTMHLSSDPGQGLKLGFGQDKPDARRETDDDDEIDAILDALEPEDESDDDESTGVIQVDELKERAEQQKAEAAEEKPAAVEESTGVINLDELQARRQTLPFGPSDVSPLPRPAVPAPSSEESTGVINLDELQRKPATPFEQRAERPAPYDDLVEPTANLPGESTPSHVAEESTGLVDVAALRAGAHLPFADEEESTLNQPANSPLAQQLRSADSRGDDLSRTMGVTRAPDDALPFRHGTARPPAAAPAQRVPAFPRDDGFLPFRPAAPPATLPKDAAFADAPQRTVGEADWASRNLLAPERCASVQRAVWQGGPTPAVFDGVGMTELAWLVEQDRWSVAIDDDAERGEHGLLFQLLDQLAEVERESSASSADTTAS